MAIEDLQRKSRYAFWREANKATRAVTEDLRESILIEFFKGNLPVPRMMFQVVLTPDSSHGIVGNYYQMNGDRYEKVGVFNLDKQIDQ